MRERSWRTFSASCSRLARFVCRLSRQCWGRSRCSLVRGSWRGGGHDWLAHWCRCGSGCRWFRSSGRLGRSRFLRLDASFPRGTGVHICRETLQFPFLFEIRGRLIRRLPNPHDIIPRIDLRADLAPGLSPLQIQGDRIPAIGSKIDVHGTGIFEQMLHPCLQRVA